MPSASLIKEFEQIVGKENVFSSEADRQSYAYDAAVLKPMIPSLVVRPTEVEQLGQVVKRCYEEGIHRTHWRVMRARRRDLMVAAACVAYVVALLAVGWL